MPSWSEKLPRPWPKLHRFWIVVGGWPGWPFPNATRVTRLRLSGLRPWKMCNALQASRGSEGDVPVDEVAEVANALPSQHRMCFHMVFICFHVFSLLLEGVGPESSSRGVSTASSFSEPAPMNWNLKSECWDYWCDPHTPRNLAQEWLNSPQAQK